jgi:hypothetical protein
MNCKNKKKEQRNQPEDRQNEYDIYDPQKVQKGILSSTSSSHFVPKHHKDDQLKAMSSLKMTAMMKVSTNRKKTSKGDQETKQKTENNTKANNLP